MSVHCRNGIYSVHYKDFSGKQRQKSCGPGEAGKMEAEALDERIKAEKQALKEKSRNVEIMASTAIQPNVPEQVNVNAGQENSTSPTLEELVTEYLANSQVNGSTENHRRSITYIAEKLFYPHFGENCPINAISYGNILDFMTKIDNEPSRNGRKRSLITLNRYGHFLSAMFRYAVDMGYLEKNPMTRWKPKKVPPKEVKLNLEDFQKIVEHAVPHLQWDLR